MKLGGRVAIVTGASSGIGRGIALEFAREGAKVSVADVQEEPKRGKYHETEKQEPTANAIADLGGEACFVEADMGDEAAIEQMMQKTLNHFGQIDILVNNAAIYNPGGSQDVSSAEWDRMTGVNLKGVFLAMKFAIPHLKASAAGRIINIASINAFAGGAGPPYTSAKAAVVNLTKDIAVELAPNSVTVNAICPGYIETPIQDYLTDEDIENSRARTPLPRFGNPRDIGQAAVFLASDDASWITGVALPVDGGWLAHI